jgi:hypothetical protein
MLHCSSVYVCVLTCGGTYRNQLYIQRPCGFPQRGDHAIFQPVITCILFISRVVPWAPVHFQT